MLNVARENTDITVHALHMSPELFTCVVVDVNSTGHDSHVLQHHSVHPESKEPLPAKVLPVQYGTSLKLYTPHPKWITRSDNIMY